jgi:predicted RNase H-like HicB family nuclease
MAHYVGVFVPLEQGGWRALFPDVPYCEVEEESLDLAIFRAAHALAEVKQSSDRPLPLPRDLSVIRADVDWASSRKVDWSCSVVTMIPLRA